MSDSPTTYHSSLITYELSNTNSLLAIFHLNTNYRLIHPQITPPARKGFHTHLLGADFQRETHDSALPKTPAVTVTVVTTVISDAVSVRINSAAACGIHKTSAATDSRDRQLRQHQRYRHPSFALGCCKGTNVAVYRPDEHIG